MNFIDLSRYEDEDQPSAGPSPSGNYIDLSRYEYEEPSAAPIQQQQKSSGGGLSDIWYSTLYGVDRLGQAASNLVGADQWAAEYGQLADQRFSQMSKEFQQDMQRSYVKEADDGSYEMGDFNLNTVLSTVTQSLPGMAAGYGVGGLATKGLGVWAGASPTVARAMTAASRVLPGAESVGAGAGLIGGAAGEGLIEGAYAKQQVEDDVFALGADELIQGSEMAQMIYASMDPSLPHAERALKTQQLMAEDLGTSALWQVGLTSAVLGGPMGARYGKLLDGVPVSSGAAKSVISNMIGEGLEESSQSAVGQLLQNVIVQNADPTRETGADVLNQAVGGAVAGVPFGGLSGLNEARIQSNQQTPGPETVPGAVPVAEAQPSAAVEEPAAAEPVAADAGTEADPGADAEDNGYHPDELLTDDEFAKLPPVVQKAFVAAANIDAGDASEAIRRNADSGNPLRVLADLKAITSGAGLPVRGEQSTEQPITEKDVPRAEKLNLKARAVETRFAKKIASDMDGAIERYKSLPDTHGGKILNTDEARKLSDDYAKDPVSRATLSAAVHEPASWLIKQMYQRELQRQPVEGQENTVLFTAGGTGSGKTTAVEHLMSDEMDKAKIVYDTNLSSFESSDQKIQQALETGHKVKIAMVYRDPVDAMVNGALPRAMNPNSSSYGRTVPLSEHIKTHAGSVDTILKLADKYGDNPDVEIAVLDNSRGKNQAALTSLAFLEKKRDNSNLEGQLKSAIQKEYESGKISEAVYRGTTGQAPTVQPAKAGGDVAANRAAGQEVRPVDGRQLEPGSEGVTDNVGEEVQRGNAGVASVANAAGENAGAKVSGVSRSDPAAEGVQGAAPQRASGQPAGAGVSRPDTAGVSDDAGSRAGAGIGDDAGNRAGRELQPGDSRNDGADRNGSAERSVSEQGSEVAAAPPVGAVASEEGKPAGTTSRGVTEGKNVPRETVERTGVQVAITPATNRIPKYRDQTEAVQKALETGDRATAERVHADMLGDLRRSIQRGLPGAVVDIKPTFGVFEGYAEPSAVVTIPGLLTREVEDTVIESAKEFEQDEVHFWRQLNRDDVKQLGIIDPKTGAANQLKVDFQFKRPMSHKEFTDRANAAGLYGGTLSADGMSAYLYSYVGKEAGDEVAATAEYKEFAGHIAAFAASIKRDGGLDSIGRSFIELRAFGQRGRGFRSYDSRSDLSGRSDRAEGVADAVRGNADKSGRDDLRNIDAGADGATGADGGSTRVGEGAEVPRATEARAVSLPGELEYAAVRTAAGRVGFVGLGDGSQVVGFTEKGFPEDATAVVAVYHKHPGKKAIAKVQAAAQKAGVRLLDVVVAGKSIGGVTADVTEPGSDARGSIGSLAGVKERFDGTGMPAAELRGHVVDIAKKLGADVGVAQSEVDLPMEALAVIERFGGQGKTDAVYLNGKIYMIADRISSPAEAIKTVLHEQVVHHGLRQMVNSAKLDAILSEVADSYGTIGLADIATRYNLDLNKPADRLVAAEERLAEVAETMEDPTLIVRAIAAIRAWLRDLGVVDTWSEGDIRSLLMASRRNLERATTPGGTRYMDADRLMKSNGYSLRDGHLRRKQADVVKQMDHLIKSKLGSVEDERSLGQKVMEKIAFWRDIDLADMKQGFLDSGASIESLERGVTGGKLLGAEHSAYKAYGLTRNMHSVYAAAYLSGVPSYRNGWFGVEPGRKGFRDIFKDLVHHPDGDLTRAWELWATAVRANRLIKETNPDGTSREKLWKQSEIDEALQLEKRYPFFKDMMAEWQDFNNQLLDLAVSRGVLDPVSRALWQSNDYVPFYRAMDEEEQKLGAGVTRQGGYSSRSLSGQKVDSKRLTGSEEKIGPVIENMFMNSAHMLNAVFKNEAMQRIADLGEGTVMERVPYKAVATKYSAEQLAKSLEKAGIALAGKGQSVVDGMSPQQRETWVTLFKMSAPKGPDIVSMYEGGRPVYFKVTDPMLLRAITAMGHNSLNGLLQMFAGAKNLLTMAITADPAFAIRNFARDTLSTFVTAPDVPMTPVVDSIKGFYKALRNDPVLLKIFAAGGYGGGFYDTNPENVRKLIGQKVPKDKLDAFFSTIVSPKKLWKVWVKIGNAAEMANRVAVFEAMKKKGVSDAEAAYMSMDIMNFSMRGDYPSTYVATSTLPFLNARIQGLYRLYRGARDNKGAFMARGMMLVGITAALWAANKDDDRYKELEEWDKDTYWHWWVGEDHYRFPKPFEVGAMFGTIPERFLQAMNGNDTWGLFGSRMGHMIKDTFAMNPVPQLVAPIVEQYANKDAFTGRPIVGMDLLRLLPEAQYDWRTSQTMRLLASAMPDALPEWLRSPKRLEAMYNGYTGTLGSYILSISDAAMRGALNAPEMPALTISDIPGIKSFYRGDEPRSTKYLTEFYDMMSEAEQVMATLKRMQTQGLDVTEFVEENRAALGARKPLNDIGDALSELNKQTKAIVANRMLTAEKKRELLDGIQLKKNELAKRGAAIDIDG